MTGPRIAIGESDFRNLREGGFYFIDKSLAIAEILDAGEKVLLVPRPRRFGKTLFMNMCREFFDRRKKGADVLFEGLAIRTHHHWVDHQGRYPVLMMSFKDAKALNWERCRQAIYGKIEALFSEHLSTIKDLDFDLYDQSMFDRFLANEPTEDDYRELPLYLCKWLQQATGQRVIILIDECDTPIHSAWDGNYYEEMIDFMRSFLSSACKDNPHLHKAVLTGILRVAKESIFSGMNNLAVCSIDSRALHTAFGFTEQEVQELLEIKGLEERLDDVGHWYNGYRFGPDRTVIYNPWSLLNFVSKPRDGLIPYWVNTARNEWIENLMTDHGRELRQELDDLIHGETISKSIEECVSMRDIQARPDLLWSLLYHSGYLRCDQMVFGTAERELRSPNEEVRQIYLGMVRRWFSQHLKSDRHIGEISKALQAGDAMLFEDIFIDLLEDILSFHDVAGEPEKVYHAIFLGMLMWFEPWFQIRSNRESGYGRYDLVLYPKDSTKYGWVIEFKRARIRRGETLESMTSDAMNQMKNKKYASDIIAQGCSGVNLVAIAFQGKDHKICIEEIS